MSAVTRLSEIANEREAAELFCETTLGQHVLECLAATPDATVSDDQVSDDHRRVTFYRLHEDVVLRAEQFAAASPYPVLAASNTIEFATDLLAAIVGDVRPVVAVGGTADPLTSVSFMFYMASQHGLVALHSGVVAAQRQQPLVPLGCDRPPCGFVYRGDVTPSTSAGRCSSWPRRNSVDSACSAVSRPRLGSSITISRAR